MDKKLSQDAVAGICMELSLLLHAGIMVSDALTLLADGSQGPEEECLREMASRTDEGVSLGQAMAQSGSFPAYATGLMAVGERSGRTEEALKALADYYTRKSRLDRQVRSALLYPAVLLGMMLVVIGVLLVKVLPIFEDVYATLGSQLTGVAGALLVLGRWLGRAMPVLLAVLAVLALVALALALCPGLRNRAMGLLGRNRGSKGLSRARSNAWVAQAMAMAMASGMELEEALELAGQLVAQDAPAALRRCQHCQELLDAGTRLGTAMGESGLLPPAQCRLLDTAQRGGSMDAAMDHIAARLSEDSEASLERWAGRVEPALVLVASALVGLILLSVMLPLMHIMSAIG